MKRPSAICVSAAALALVMFTPTKVSAGGYYNSYSYGCCCVITYCYGVARGRVAYVRYAQPSYRYQRYGYQRARGYARRQLRREAVRGW